MTVPADPQLSDQLVQKAQKGDTEAVGALYETHRLNVFRYLYYRTGDIQVAEDLTSEVFVRMINALAGYRRQEVPFLAWLFQIARNLLNDHYRKMNVRNHVQLEEGMTEDPINPRTRPIERSLSNVTLQQAISHLSDDQRDVIFLRFISGMPIAEVARALNKSEDAVKGLQRRALLALRDVLSEREIKYV